jgi:hypothetical protein
MHSPRASHSAGDFVLTVQPKSKPFLIASDEVRYVGSANVLTEWTEC